MLNSDFSEMKGELFMKESFGTLPSGQQATLYTISCGRLTAAVTDLGATLVRLLVPDAAGNVADVVLGHDDANGYLSNNGFLGAIVGRNANRVKDATFPLNGRQVRLTPLDSQFGNNLHSGPDCFHTRLWDVVHYEASSITFRLESPDGDQGFPGNATIRVTYSLDDNDTLHVIYDGICDKDTVFNMTNHSYFNLAGHDHPEAAMNQLLTLPARFFNADDAESIPTGELRPVEGSPMDFRTPKPIGRDINEDYDALNLQSGYDHNFEVFTNPCAILSDPISGRTMAVSTDLPGVQFYAGNYLDQTGKGGVYYGKRSGVALETQYYPDSVNHPEWPQPFVKAGVPYHTETKFRFK